MIKKECYTSKKSKTSIMSWIGFDKVHRVIKFNQKACSKPYIDMITELRKKPKNDFERDFFKLISNSV